MTTVNSVDDKSKRIMDLFKQLEAEGVRIAPIQDKNAKISEIKHDDIGVNLAEKLKRLGSPFAKDDWWVEASWTMSF